MTGLSELWGAKEESTAVSVDVVEVIEGELVSEFEITESEALLTPVDKMVWDVRDRIVAICKLLGMNAFGVPHYVQHLCMPYHMYRFICEGEAWFFEDERRAEELAILRRVYRNISKYTVREQAEMLAAGELL